MSTIDPRHQARSLALQTLYELDCTDHEPGSVLEHRLATEAWEQPTRQLTERLVRGVLEYRTDLDRLIQEYAPEWPLDQLAIIDRNILRIAAYELSIEPNVPAKVAINEAILLAKTFGAESTPRFINGVLGSLLTHQRQAAQKVKKGEGASSSD